MGAVVGALVAFVAGFVALASFDRLAHRWVSPATARFLAWWRWRPVDPPEVLLDPDGEGVFVRAERAYAVASRLLGVYWRDLDAELAWMRVETDGEHWRRRPQTWRLDMSLNLPHRWHRAVDYLYFTPRPLPSEGTER